MKWNKVILATLFLVTFACPNTHSMGIAPVLRYAAKPLIEGSAKGAEPIAKAAIPFLQNIKTYLLTFGAGLTIPTALVASDAIDHIPKTGEVGNALVEAGRNFLPSDPPTPFLDQSLRETLENIYKPTLGVLVKGAQKHPYHAAIIGAFITYQMYKRYQAAKLAQQVQVLDGQPQVDMRTPQHQRGVLATAAELRLPWWLGGWFINHYS